MAARSVQIHCTRPLEEKTLKLTIPASWSQSPVARLLKVVAKRCAADAGALRLETASGAKLDGAAPLASTDADVFFAVVDNKSEAAARAGV